MERCLRRWRVPWCSRPGIQNQWQWFLRSQNLALAADLTSGGRHQARRPGQRHAESPGAPTSTRSLIWATTRASRDTTSPMGRPQSHRTGRRGVAIRGCRRSWTYFRSDQGRVKGDDGPVARLPQEAHCRVRAPRHDHVRIPPPAREKLVRCVSIDSAHAMMKAGKPVSCGRAWSPPGAESSIVASHWYHLMPQGRRRRLGRAFSLAWSRSGTGPLC